MKLDLKHLDKSALSAVLFICVYHVVNALLHGTFFIGFIFLCSAIYCSRTLINEQQNTHGLSTGSYTLVVISVWFSLYSLLLTANNPSPAIGLWSAILVICTSILLKPTNAFRLNTIAVSVFWVIGFLKASQTFIYLESALSLTIVVILSSFIQALVYDLKSKLIIAKETDSLTGSMQAESFKLEVEKVVQLFERYETPFSLICIQYDTRFQTEAELHIWLKELAGFYQSRLRKTDILCRFNSQKFMILLPSTTIPNAEALSLELENCTTAYEFTFKNNSSAVHTAPTLSFSTETLNKNESFEDWFRTIQSK